MMNEDQPTPAAQSDKDPSVTAGINKEMTPVVDKTDPVTGTNQQQQQQGEEDKTAEAKMESTTTGINSNSNREEPEEVHHNPTSVSDALRDSIMSVLEDGSTSHYKQHQQRSDYVHKKHDTNRNSLELRKLPVSILLHPDDTSIGASTINDDSFEDEISKAKNSASVSLLHKTCLNSNFSLKMQMMLSFGLVSVFTIIIVMIVSLAATIVAGNRVSDITQDTFTHLAEDIAGTTAHHLSDDLTPRILPVDLVQILYEATRDRFAGYPIYDSDDKVPFHNFATKKGHYPLQGTPLPLDWQMGEHGGNVNETNFEEHVQNRLAWYDHSPTLDTTSAAFYIQGMCDPDAFPNESRYFPNCTHANNNITTGGVIAPSPTSAQIHRKASDLNPLLKSLYEYHQDVKNIGIYFSNSGAGATVVFPHYELNSSQTYVSTGCNWMLNDHPVDHERTTFATLEDFERCELGGLHQNGKEISTRLYNPMDQEWCRDQASYPDKVHHVGPFESAWSDTQWLMAIGKAVYDRITKEFIGCTSVDFVLDSVEAILHSSKVTPGSEVSVVRFNMDGTVVASTAWNPTFANGTVTVDDLKVGITQESYQTLFELVDYRAEWDPNETVKTYEEYLMHDDGYLVAAYPMPPVPEEYQQEYLPEFLVVVSVAEEEFFKRSNDLKDSVDETAVQLGRIILIVGFVGLGMMVIIIFTVANALTAPLTYMNQVAADIVNNFGDTTAEDDDAIEVDRKILDSKCVPRTELDDIVKEFSKMVSNFSGSAMARAEKGKVTEIENRFNLVDEFRQLYESRSDAKFKYRFPGQQHVSVEEKLERKGAPPYRVNFGRNISRDSLAFSGSTFNTSRSDSIKTTSNEERMRSPLFFWIVVLIVSPLLLTTITISCILMVNISQSFPEYVDDAKAQFVNEEIFALNTYVALRANLTAVTTERAIRDLHVLTRYTGWLLFGGLNMTDGLNEMTSGVEECKIYDNISQCPYVLEQNCDCAWGLKGAQCSEYAENTRYLHPPFYAAESHDTEPDGDRFTTTFPDVSFSPASTAWWDNMTTLPGSGNISWDSRYESTYDRLRSASGLPVLQLLYNYNEQEGEFITGVYVAYEADGLMVGYIGCKDPGHPSYAGWHSNVANGAYDLRPELCPLGKYGYDPRCRFWYDKGKEAKGRNESAVYTTPPYRFVSRADTYAQSASSPLVNPRTGEHVGQTLVDFISQPILDSLSKKNFALSGRGFPILITIEEDNFKADAVIGPGLQKEAKPIADLVLPHNSDCEEDESCEEGFYKILKSMKAGENGTAKFNRVGRDGDPETIYISYSPVVVKTFSAVDGGDFGRGVSNSPYLLYSLAFAEFEDEMLSEFYQIEEDIDIQFYITLALLCVTILLSTLFVIYFSKVITVSMTDPMIQLLELVRTINSLKDGEDKPEPPIDRQYGSWEVLNVTCTMERLYKVIRSANTAYFAGDVEKAYEVLRDALRLFKRIGNKKAIGVACNNLGNCLLAAYRTLKATKEKRICGFKKREIILKGTACFHEAIQQGEKAYDEFYEREGWSPNCLDFMQHLSNRYFNRAMFLLTVKDDHTKPDEIQELGMRDLQISRDMDVEIIDEGTQVGWNVRGPNKTYDVMLSRFKGHLTLLEMGYSDDFELEEWMCEAFQIVRKELKNRETSALFEDLGPAARMQQIELELMKYFTVTADIATAAKIAIRLLVEDEFTLPSAQLQAVKVLQEYVDKEEHEIRKDVRGALAEYRRRVEVSVEEIDVQLANQTETDLDNASDVMSLGTSLFGGESKPNEVSSFELSDRRRISLMESTRGDITMEDF